MATNRQSREARDREHIKASQSAGAGDEGRLPANSISSRPFESGNSLPPGPESDAALAPEGHSPHDGPSPRSMAEAIGWPASVTPTEACRADATTGPPSAREEGSQLDTEGSVTNPNVTPAPPDEPVAGQLPGSVDAPVPASASPEAVLPGVRDVLAEFRTELAGIVKGVAALQDAQSAHAQLGAAYMEIAARKRQLEEQFYEHEVLGGISRTLISLADRARDVRARLARTLERDAALPAAEVCTSCASVLEYIDLHILDIHTSLTTLGVECYAIPGPQFDPLLQCCLARVPVSDQRRHGEIAGRIAPGYRRNGHVIRHEQVRVYVVAHDATPALKGD